MCIGLVLLVERFPSGIDKPKCNWTTLQPHQHIQLKKKKKNNNQCYLFDEFKFWAILWAALNQHDQWPSWVWCENMCETYQLKYIRTIHTHILNIIPNGFTEQQLKH